MDAHHHAVAHALGARVVVAGVDHAGGIGVSGVLVVKVVFGGEEDGGETVGETGENGGIGNADAGELVGVSGHRKSSFQVKN